MFNTKYLSVWLLNSGVTVIVYGAYITVQTGLVPLPNQHVLIGEELKVRKELCVSFGTGRGWSYKNAGAWWVEYLEDLDVARAEAWAADR